MDIQALKEQVEQERQALLTAPSVPITAGTVTRCSFCGRMSAALVRCETMGTVERYCCEACHPDCAAGSPLPQ